MGKALAEYLAKGRVVTFEGNLGSGKTTLIKGICQGLGIEEPVTSPTFTLVNEYQGRLPVYHFDFYRIEDSSELLDLGLEEYFYGQGVCLIEWPEQVQAWLPDDHWKIRLESRFIAGWENKRKLTLDIPHEIFEKIIA